MGQQVDYDALASQHGGQPDYDALAAAHGAITPDFTGANEKDAQGNAVVAAYAAATTPAERARVLQQTPVGQDLRNLPIGIAKGAANTVLGMVDFWNQVPPIRAASDYVQEKLVGKGNVIPPEQLVESTRAATRPSNTTQRVGYTGEQIGEFFLPTGAKAKGAVIAAEAAKSGALTLLQGGSPAAAGTSAALSAALPLGAGAIKGAVADALETSAAKGVVQALGPTKERYKAIAARLVPQILKRGLRGSRESLQAKAADTLETVGAQLDDALQTFGSQPVSTAPITTALETAKDAFRTTSAAGKVVEFEPRAIKQLDGLKQVIDDLGPNATVDQLVAVRRAWDKVVAQAGGFAQRSGGAIGVPLKDQSEAWAKREATGAIRQLLETDVPQLAAINKEWAFWKNLDDVLTQTLQRTQPQGPGLLRQGAEAAGQVVGATAGSSAGPAGAVGGAFALGKLAKFADTVFASPRWKLASAQTKDAVAQAIVSGKPSQIAAALSRVSAAAPGQVLAPAR